MVINQFLQSRKSIFIIIKYALFAGLSIVVNLFTQYLVDLMISGKWAIYISIFFGTGAGLVVKYALDKYYIFFHESKSVQNDFTNFLLYSLMGVVTTIIFWGSELLFYYLFEFDSAKYLGGLVGLVIGYIIKYKLDKKYVFNGIKYDS